jgi:major intracellular serine protease
VSYFGSAASDKQVEAYGENIPQRLRVLLRGHAGELVTVAVIDSGWDRLVVEPRVTPGVTIESESEACVTISSDDADRIGHGTTVTQMILHVAPRCTILPIRIFLHRLEATVAQLVTAIRWAVDSGAYVINLSLACRSRDSLRELYSACEYARRAGCILVAAGDNDRHWSMPSVFDNVIGVGAGRFTSQYSFRAESDLLEFSAFAPAIRRSNGTVLYPTSFATANLTGILALLLSGRETQTLADARRLLYAAQGLDER